MEYYLSLRSLNIDFVLYKWIRDIFIFLIRMKNFLRYVEIIVYIEMKNVCFSYLLILILYVFLKFYIVICIIIFYNLEKKCLFGSSLLFF